MPGEIYKQHETFTGNLQLGRADLIQERKQTSAMRRGETQQGERYLLKHQAAICCERAFIHSKPRNIYVPYERQQGLLSLRVTGQVGTTQRDTGF